MKNKKSELAVCDFGSNKDINMDFKASFFGVNNTKIGGIEVYGINCNKQELSELYCFLKKTIRNFEEKYSDSVGKFEKEIEF
jgi:hypothetical protein